MNIQNHPVVSREEWLAARKQHLAHEKAFTKERDRLSAERRALPWVKIDKDYHFQGANGELKLADLFGGHSQLVIYHFMFAKGWEEGCPGLLVPQRPHRRRQPASGPPRHRRGGGFPRTVRRVPGRSNGAWAGSSTGCRQKVATSTMTSAYRARAEEVAAGKATYNYEKTDGCRGRNARAERVLSQ